MFDRYRDRIVVAEIDAKRRSSTTSTSSCTTPSPSPRPTTTRSTCSIDNPHARRVVVYTWNFHPELIDSAIEQGRQRLPLEDAARARPRRRPRSDPRRRDRDQPAAGQSPTDDGLDWPGRSEGLTDRESEILALITQGKSNIEVAAITYFSKNSIKSYIRSTYRKIGVKQPHPSRALGRRARLQARPPPHRPLAGGGALGRRRPERAAHRTTTTPPFSVHSTVPYSNDCTRPPPSRSASSAVGRPSGDAAPPFASHVSRIPP